MIPLSILLPTPIHDRLQARWRQEAPGGPFSCWLEMGILVVMSRWKSSWAHPVSQDEPLVRVEDLSEEVVHTLRGIAIAENLWPEEVHAGVALKVLDEGPW